METLRIEPGAAGFEALTHATCVLFDPPLHYCYLVEFNSAGNCSVESSAAFKEKEYGDKIVD